MRVPRPGLRGRLAIALVLTAAVALAVAALTLLAPLERKLRTQEVRDLVAAAVQSRASFRELDVTGSAALKPRLRRRVRRVASITGAHVALLNSQRQVVIDTDPDSGDKFTDAGPALLTDRAVRRIIATGSHSEARVAVRIVIDGHRYVLALRKPLTEQRAAAVQVQHAFGTAALVALAVALLAAGALATSMGRRLRALRDAVVQFPVAQRPELPPDRAPDEIGDLNRAFVAMADRLARQEDVRREFVSTASHELRTPLMALQGRLELLSDELATAQPDLVDSRRQLAEAREQAERLGRLAADLLDLSRLDSDIELRRERIDIADLVRAVAGEFILRARDQKRALELDLQPAPAIADPSAAARVVRVLLDNAFNYSERGTPVAVTTGVDDGHVVVTVGDHGPGVPEADRARVFERFARGSGAAPGGGFGLGLAIARELSTHMGGSLELAADGDRGATFALQLPQADGRTNEIPT